VSVWARKTISPAPGLNAGVSLRCCARSVDPEPTGARLAVKSFLHDFGDYLEVVCYFDENLPDSVEYALHCEANLPATWDDESRTPLQ
jgi:hypothetical protein